MWFRLILCVCEGVTDGKCRIPFWDGPLTDGKCQIPLWEDAFNVVECQITRLIDAFTIIDVIRGNRFERVFLS